MEQLIEALQIFLKYGNPDYPTDCRDETLFIIDIHVDDVSKEDVETLYKLGFFWSGEEEGFKSFRFGSC